MSSFRAFIWYESEEHTKKSSKWGAKREGIILEKTWMLQSTCNNQFYPVKGNGEKCNKDKHKKANLYTFLHEDRIFSFTGIVFHFLLVTIGLLVRYSNRQKSNRSLEIEDFIILK